MKATYGAVLVIVALAVVPATAQKEQTWKGAISDSNCNGKHAAGEHDGKKMTDTDCTNVCIKKGGKVRIRLRWQGLRAGQPELEDHRRPRRPPGRADRNAEGRRHQRHEDHDAGGQIRKGWGLFSEAPAFVDPFSFHFLRHLRSQLQSAPHWVSTASFPRQRRDPAPAMLIELDWSSYRPGFQFRMTVIGDAVDAPATECITKDFAVAGNDLYW